MHKKGWIPSPATMLWFLCEQHTCRGGTGKQPHQWALSEGAACRTALGLVLGPVGSPAAPGQGYPALLPETNWTSALPRPLLGGQPHHPGWAPPGQEVLCSSSTSLWHLNVERGGLKPRLPNLRQGYSHALTLSLAPHDLGVKPGCHGHPFPHCRAWWVQTSSSMAFLRDARKLSAPKRMAVTRTKCWLSLDLVRKGMCRFHSNPQMQWVLAFLSTSPSPSFPAWLPNGKAHYS